MDSNFFFNLLWPRTISICYDEDVGFGSTFFFFWRMYQCCCADFQLIDPISKPSYISLNLITIYSVKHK
jgi:hypothetical protein